MVTYRLTPVAACDADGGGVARVVASLEERLTGMDDERLKKIKYLANCSFLPGSYAKRFVRDMSTRPVDYTPTIRQALFIDKLYYQYRKQISAMRGTDKPEFIRPGEVME